MPDRHAGGRAATAGQRLGKRMLQHATERTQQQQFGAARLRMVVVSARSELLAFICAAATGVAASCRNIRWRRVGQPLRTGLTIEMLEKPRRQP